GDEDTFVQQGGILNAKAWRTTMAETKVSALAGHLCGLRPPKRRSPFLFSDRPFVRLTFPTIINAPVGLLGGADVDFGPARVSTALVGQTPLRPAALPGA